MSGSFTNSAFCLSAIVSNVKGATMRSRDATSEHINKAGFQCSDAGLLTAARAGSEMAFTELHALYGRRLYRKILSITGNHEDAEDALQDTLLHAYLAINSFEGRSKLSSWLTQIAINSALMTLRKRRMRREAMREPLSDYADDSSGVQLRDRSPNPEEVCLHDEKKRRLEHAMIGLKPSFRTIIRLQVDNECSVQEIATSLDLSTAATKTRLHRAKRQLAVRALNAR
jgi:RNA polymerase sigma-70 factor, ECF subfamily